MKVVKRVFFSMILFMLCFFNAVAKNPPPPSSNAKMTAPPPPTPPGLPIDENILILMLVALLFGIYIIYNFKIKQKTPM